jgi:hypothetical protein
LARPLASPCRGHEPKVRVAIGDQNLIALLDRGDHFLNKGGQIQSHFWIVMIITSTKVEKFGDIRENEQSFLG